MFVRIAFPTRVGNVTLDKEYNCYWTNNQIKIYAVTLACNINFD